MRVVDFYLCKVAGKLEIDYDPRSWSAVGKFIAKQMEQKYHTKTDDWKQGEPFYASVLSDLNAIGRAHRNPAIHDLDKKYDDREAKHMLDIVESFAKHVAEGL